MDQNQKPIKLIRKTIDKCIDISDHLCAVKYIEINNKRIQIYSLKHICIL